MDFTNSPRTGKRMLVAFLLDRTGSMEHGKQDTINGFNGYLKELSNSSTPIDFNLVQFDSEGIDQLATNVEPSKAPRLNTDTYQPRGMTNLLDATEDLIRATERAYEQNYKEGEKPLVTIVIQTDGQENASRRATWNSVNELIKSKKHQGWQFTFLGADIDAFTPAKRMGIDLSKTASYSKSRSDATFAASARNTVAYAATADSASLDYSEEDRATFQESDQPN